MGNLALVGVAGVLLMLFSICGFTVPGTGPEPTPTPFPTPHVTATPIPTDTPTPAHTQTPGPTPTTSYPPLPTPTYTPQPTVTYVGKVPVPNGDFETGTYEHWVAEDIAFGTAPSDMDAENRQGTFFGAPYTGYHGRYAASSFIPRHEAGAIGTLTSDEFTIAKPYLEFLVTGAESGQLYMEVWVGGAMVKHYGPKNSGTDFMRVSLDVSPWVGRTARIKVVDSTPNRPWGYLEVDDFYMTDAPSVTPS